MRSPEIHGRDQDTANFTGVCGTGNSWKRVLPGQPVALRIPAGELGFYSMDLSARSELSMELDILGDVPAHVAVYGCQGCRPTHVMYDVVQTSSASPAGPRFANVTSG
ncbi:hypothetical protein Bbelb_100790 [Branchiostoma belcheri]|nr:hypothetical protein Bbelb_100790 [Branchiostoma belcheri]